MNPSFGVLRGAFSANKRDQAQCKAPFFSYKKKAARPWDKSRIQITVETVRVLFEPV